MLQNEFEFKLPECPKILELLLLVFFVDLGFFFTVNQYTLSNLVKALYVSLMSHVPQSD